VLNDLDRFHITERGEDHPRILGWKSSGVQRRTG
jgi:hypothetical protein